MQLQHAYSMCITFNGRKTRVLYEFILTPDSMSIV